MIGYVLRRFAAMALTFWAMTFVAFIIMELPPGDYATARVSEMSAAGVKIDPAMVERLREMYQLDAPVLVRYFSWFGRVLQGDFGYSLAFSQPVSEMIATQLPNTLLVDGLTLIFMWISFAYFGIVLGGLQSQAYVGAPFSLAKLGDLASHLWAPILVAGAAGMASLIRVTRANLLDELRKPYVTTARAKGLEEWKLILKYPVRMAMSPLVSSIGWVLPNLISAATVVAIVMNMPTLGPLLLSALMIQDMFLAGGVLVVMAILTLVGTLLSDILLYWLDPRVRAAGL